QKRNFESPQCTLAITYLVADRNWAFEPWSALFNHASKQRIQYMAVCNIATPPSQGLTRKEGIKTRSPLVKHHLAGQEAKVRTTQGRALLADYMTLIASLDFGRKIVVKKLLAGSKRSLLMMRTLVQLQRQLLKHGENLVDNISCRACEGSRNTRHPDSGFIQPVKKNSGLHYVTRLESLSDAPEELPHEISEIYT
ncbi:13507_t:CDS:2, partial [Acaulospora colombiana]